MQEYVKTFFVLLFSCRWFFCAARESLIKPSYSHYTVVQAVRYCGIAASQRYDLGAGARSEYEASAQKKGCHFVVIPRLKQPKNNPNNDSLLLANYLILNNSVVETASIESHRRVIGERAKFGVIGQPSYP